jgi:predicted TIM-barrel fold metal-dependent hydrolase
MDMHTHFLRDDTRITGFVAMRAAVGKAGWNKELSGHEQTIDDLKYANYVKEVFLDSDSKIVLISSAPSDIEQDRFLTNEQMAAARDKVNKRFGSRRLFSHAIFTPGQPGWLEKVDAALELKPESMKGYTIGDNTHKETSRYPWRMDDEKVAYKGYEKFVKAGIKNVCVHKGLSAPPLDRQFPNLRGFVDASDVGQAAKDWPQLNFIIYHGAYRHVGGDPKVALAEFERTGRISWTSDLADVPATYDVTNVYADVRSVVRYDANCRAASYGRPDGRDDQENGRRQGLLGNRCRLDRLTSMADRRAASLRDPRGHAEEIRLRAARASHRPC